MQAGQYLWRRVCQFWEGGERAVKSPVLSHSVSIDGHRTSISLEEAFWNALKDIANERGESLSHLINSINANRQLPNLSSAIRVFALRHYMHQAARLREMIQQHETTVQ
jgi:predicted DNA-binding ribbon-helix-helix protein